MKFLDLVIGPERPSESDLKDIVAESDARLGQASTLVYTPDTVGDVNLDDLARGSKLDSPAIPDDGFEPNPVLGGVKSPW